MVRSPRTWREVLRGGLGLGESYADGLWDTPDLTAVIELAARNMGGIDELRRRLSPVREPYQRGRQLLTRNTPQRAREGIHAHYDLGNDLFRLILDDDDDVLVRASSSAASSRCRRRRRPSSSASADKLELGPGDHVLEIGTGWGGFAVHAARDPRLPRHDDDDLRRAARARRRAGRATPASRTASRCCSRTTASWRGRSTSSSRSR